MRVIRLWHGPIEVALDINQSEPNIAWDSDVGGYIVRVERQELFPDDPTHESYLTLYKLYVDDATTAFVPVFGPAVARIYFNRYREERSTARSDLAKGLAPMIAALVSTGDPDMICREVRSLHHDGVRKSDIQRELVEVSAAGFPDFKDSACGSY